MIKRLRLIILILLVVSLVACRSSSTGKTISTGSVVDNLQEQEKIQKEINILTRKEKFDLDYADGAYLEDYTEVRKRLNKEAQVYYKEFFKDKLPEDFYFRVDLDLFYSLLRKARDESLSYETILNDYSDQIEDIMFTGFAFDIDPNDYEVNESVISKIHFILIHGNLETFNFLPHHRAIVYNIAPKHKAKVLNELDREVPISEMLANIANDFESDEVYSVVSELRLLSSNDKTSTGLGADLLRMEKAYNKKFVFVDEVENREFYAPLDNPKILFEAHNNKDTYYATLAADYLTSNMYQVLEKLEVTDRMGLFVSAPVNTKAIPEEKYTGVFKDYERYIDGFTTLYYIVDDEESVDYNLLYKVKSELDKFAINEDYPRWLYIIPITMDEAYRATFLKLLRENPLTENYIRDSGFGANWVIVRNNSEAFQYFDLYGSKVNFLFRDSDNANKDMEPKVYFDSIKMKNEYERWRD